MFFQSLNTVFAFILTLGILVTFHEFGHFWVARRCGVKVLRFSIGFGKPIVTWNSSAGTEFCIAMIPLGGYVKMLDEREGDVATEDKPYSFLSQPAYNKIAIVAAGPLANFLLAIILLWIMFIVGSQVAIPIVGKVDPNSIAQVQGIKKNDIITKVNGKQTHGWQNVEVQLLTALTNSENIKIQLKRDDLVYNIVLPINNLEEKKATQSAVNFLGINYKQPEIPAILGEIVTNSVADLAGLQPNDLILAIDETPIQDWDNFVTIIRANPENELSLRISRNNQQLLINIIPDFKLTDTGKIGYIGCKFKVIKDDSMVKVVRYNIFTALYKAIDDFFALLTLTAKSIWNMLRGLMSIQNLGGPITIAKFASFSMETGLDSFLYFLAMLSISLGFINLLPIPALDGGHLLFHLIEWIKGDPLSEKVQLFFLRIGVSIIVTLMIFSIFNDLMRNL
jgi:regulator of sigma E protease